MIPLSEQYKKEVIPQMMAKFGYKSPMAVPKIQKVAVNSGFGRLVVGKTSDEQKKTASGILDDLTSICGQKAVLTKAKKSIASFKTRQGMPIGAKVTLRGKRMHQFLERVINIALPRSRDFRGINQKSFDGEGNLTISIKEQIIFPEIMPEKTRTIFGFEITVATSAKTREEGMELLKLMHFPIKN